MMSPQPSMVDRIITGPVMKIILTVVFGVAIYALLYAWAIGSTVGTLLAVAAIGCAFVTRHFAKVSRDAVRDKWGGNMTP
jgi:hypothetical protein